MRTLMLAKTTKSTLLEAFYQFISEDEWLEGLDLYQAGKVVKTDQYESLITAQIKNHQEVKVEVRMKINPDGKQIQWIECTCRRNRVQSAYCEHMGALMIHLDREGSKLIAKLDPVAPLKPPLNIGRKRATPAEKAKAEDTTKKGVGAAQTILDHLDTSIHSVGLLAKGPMIRVRLEIKEGQITHYDLDLDASAKFLKSHAKLKKLSPEVSALKVFSNEALLGTLVYEAGKEEIVAERVIAIDAISDAPESKHSKVDKCRIFSKSSPERKKAKNYQFIDITYAKKFFGKEYLFLPERGYFPLNKKDVSTDWYELPKKKVFLNDEAAQLIESNYAPFLDSGPIFLSESLVEPRIIHDPKLMQIQIQGEQDGWFHLNPEYGDGKTNVSMIAMILKYRKDKRNFHKDGDTWIKIPEIVKQFPWELDESESKLKVNSLGLLRLKAALGDFDQFVGSKFLLNKVREKTEFKEEMEIPSLSDSKLSLRPYQEMGLRWLWWLYQNQLHGLLADEMGLGKTHQAMGLMTCIQTAKKETRFLVVCPKTVIEHWEDKIVNFCPNLKVHKHHGPKRDQRLSGLGKDYNIVITSYGILLRDINFFSKVEWDAVFLDEAHFVKNNDTATHNAVCRVNAKVRVCLSGTPLENRLEELKSIFDFLIPGYLGSDDYFKKNFMTPIIENNFVENELALQKLIHPFKMRRTKALVLTDLPEKVEDIRHCTLSDEQVKMYREIVDLKAAPLVQKLQDENAPVSYLHVFATLTLLKQVCNHPALVTKDQDFAKHESGKFELLKELLTEAIDSGHKIVIYSQYVEMVHIIERYLKSINVGHVILTGQSRKRGEIISKFQTDESIKVFVGSLLAGGIGIDLTAASVVIHYDRWWNASKENQATDRVHRIGQNKNVQVFKLVTKGTLEEKIDAMIRRKQALFERFLDHDEELFKNLTRQEMIELLQ
jgi:SNF2 family DNA or RNA helicase